MAQGRATRGASAERETARERKPADRDEQDIIHEDDPEAEDERQVPVEDGAEAFGGDEPEASGEDELSADGRRKTSRRDIRRSKRPARDGAHPARGGGSVPTAREAAKAALSQLVELTGKPAESVTAVERTEDGWSIEIEVVEDRRVPSSTDILATYETVIDADCELLSYRRVRRYSRGHGDNGEEL